MTKNLIVQDMETDELFELETGTPQHLRGFKEVTLLNGHHAAVLLLEA